MKSFRRMAPYVFALVTLAGCASTTVTSRETYQGERLARPERILVHDFAATPADLPAWSAAAKLYASSAPPPDPAVLELGRTLGAQVAQELVTKIQGMGLPAVRAAGQPAPRGGEIVLIGYFTSLDEGSTAKRVALGFGSGAAEMTTYVEGYLMTDQGLRKLGSGTVDAGGGKVPGVVAPLAVTLATANPIGLIVGGAVKVGGEVTGKSTIEGTAKRTAEKLAEELRVGFQRQGWI